MALEFGHNKNISVIKTYISVIKTNSYSMLSNKQCGLLRLFFNAFIVVSSILY